MTFYRAFGRLNYLKRFYLENPTANFNRKSLFEDLEVLNCGIIDYMKKSFNIIKNIIIIVGGILILSPFIFLYRYITDNQDTCLDISVCKEGLPLNIEGKKIIINKQTCKENNGTWHPDKKVCHFK